MNYLQELKIQRESAERRMAHLHNGIVDLKVYLNSDKFRDDTTVQVKDVLHRLSEIESGELDVQVQYENAAYESLRNKPPKPAAYILYDQETREYSAYTMEGGDFLGKSSQREALKRSLSRKGYQFP